MGTHYKNLESKDQKYWSRWVVQGDQQRTNISLSNTFAPVSRISSLRILLPFTTIEDLRIFTWDVDLAYLHGKIDHDIFIKFPDGYDKPGKVAKLNKVLFTKDSNKEASPEVRIPGLTQMQSTHWKESSGEMPWTMS